MNNLEKFFDPKSVAIIGASTDPKKVGFALMSNLLSGKNRDIYPITLKEKEILGVPAFASILDVPNEIDLVVIAVRADAVPQILVDCGKKQISNAIIISSGFKEIGPAGKEIEDWVAKIAIEQKINLLGPNCLGVIDTKNDLNASFAVQKPLPGRIALLSQSGALGTAMLDWAAGEGVGFSKFISLGNEARLTEIDFLEYLSEDPDTDAVLVYLEKISNGSEFMRIASQIAAKKPVIVLKAGVSERGVRAVSSHTGSLAPQASVFTAACKQAGAVMVSSLREFFNVAKLLSLGLKINNPVQNLIILTNGGGPSIVAADLVDASRSLTLVELDEEIKWALRGVLPPMAAFDNPVDIIGDALSERYEKALDILCEAKNADGIIVMLTPQMMTETEATARLLSKYKDKKKIFPVFMGGSSIQSGRAALIESGLVHFVFPKDVIEALDDLANNAPKTGHSSAHPVSEGAASEQMKFRDTLKLLNEFNLSIVGKFVENKNDLGKALHECGDGPYVMKAIGNTIIHKTDVEAVKLNISDLDEINTVWGEMENKFSSIEGMLVQPMFSGREVIIGVKRYPTFGPAVLFGLGGILAEAIKDTTLRVVPISKEEALKMMQEIKGIKILQGMRGEKPVNFDLLANIIVNLSHLALEHPEIKEIDLNPVISTDSSATIVDARMMI